MKLLRQRKRFSQTALAANSSSLLAYICFALIIFAGHSLMVSLFADNSLPHVYVKLLARLLPGSLALLLSSSDKHWSSVWFFRPSLTLLGSTEKPLVAVPSFPLHIYDRKFEFQVVLFIFLLLIPTDRKQHNTWKKAKKKNVQCQWSRLLPLFKNNKLIRLGIYFGAVAQ